MPPSNKDTIYALASGRGPAGIAVFRISGPSAGWTLQRLSGKAPGPARRAERVRLRGPDDTDVDDGLALWFPQPHSFTGEDVAELHVHGGRAVVADVLAALAACTGLRPAEAGEFTRRAFENGKLDLTAAEGLADLVQAETSAQRRQALRQMRGELGRLYDGWRTRLVRALAHLEAVIDFADEDLPAGAEAGAHADMAALEQEIAAHLADGRRGERLREGVRLVILGPPNAGKSSLLNVLARRDAAIVAAEPGTTRDVIEVHLDLGGVPVLVADTAGLRQATGEVEREGVRRSLHMAEDADIRLVVFDGALWPHTDAAARELVNGATIAVVNKVDLGQVPARPDVGGVSALGVSARTGAGIDAMLAVIAERVAQQVTETETPVLTRHRHREALEECRVALVRGLAAAEMELEAEDLRLAARALGRITGRVDVEDLLDVIFRDFCIGK